jgi:hypothetical protein
VEPKVSRIEPSLADEEEAGAAHVARDEGRLAEVAVRGGEERMAGAERAGRALAVDAEPSAAVLLELRDIVADVVDEPRLERLLGDRERAGEDLPGEGGHDLPVDPRVVGRAAHRGEVALRLGRPERRAAELAVGELDAVVAARLHHGLEEIVAHLVAEAARARMDREADRADLEPEVGGDVLAVDLVDDLDLEEVVAAAEGADLGHAAREGALAHGLRIGAGIESAVLDVVEVVGRAVAVVDRPLRALGDDRGRVVAARGLDGALAADAGGDGAEEVLHELAELRLDVGAREARPDDADAAVDVVAHAAGRDDAFLLLECGDAADGKAVAPVEVGHGEGVAHDAGEVGDVADLLDRLVGLLRFHELPRGVDPSGDAHGAGLRDFVEVRGDLLQLSHEKDLPQRHGGHREEPDLPRKVRHKRLSSVHSVSPW